MSEGGVVRPDFVVGFNPVPMANQVVSLGSRVRRDAAGVLVAAVVAGGLWWWQRSRVDVAWLVLLWSASLVLLAVGVARLLRARRHLARIGAGPALEADRQGLVLHGLDGRHVRLDWTLVTAVRTAGLKVGAGPEIVVETAAGRAWSMPLSFLDALPGTIDGGLRACSGGRLGLDLSGLDTLF